MKILVTGMTSRQANPEASKRDVTFAHLLTEALLHQGHDVEHRDPHILEDLSDFDHAFVGLAPLHGLGANRMYGALAVILRTWGDGKLSLYTDDPDMAKVTGGIRTMVTNPDRFTKPFFAYKKEHDIASEPAWRDWLNTGVKMLNDTPWPRLIVPGFSWSSPYDYYRTRVPHAEGRISTLDLTSFLPGEELEPNDAPEQRWVTEAKRGDKWLNRTRPQHPVAFLGTPKSNADERRPADPQLLELYHRSQGVLHSPIDPIGFWHSRIGYAAKAGTVFTTRWQDVQPLGDAYTVLPATVDDLGSDGRTELVERQRAALLAVTPDKDAAAQSIIDIIKPAEVAA